MVKEFNNQSDNPVLSIVDNAEYFEYVRKVHDEAGQGGGNDLFVERFDLLYPDGRKIRKDENSLEVATATRKLVHQNGLWHAAVLVCLIDKYSGDILIQQRGDNKDKNATLWDVSAAGHVPNSSDPVQCVAREMFEEISNLIPGSSVKVQDMRVVGNSYRDSRVYSENFIENQFYTLVAYKSPKKLNLANISIQESEVKDIDIVSLDKLIKMSKSKEFVPGREEAVMRLTEYVLQAV